MGFKICIINQEHRTYFHGQENYLTVACFETLTVERLWGENKIIEDELLLFSKNKFYDMYQYKRIFMHGSIGALEKCMHYGLSETRAFS